MSGFQFGTVFGFQMNLTQIYPIQTMLPKFFEWTIGKRKHEFAIYVPTYIFSLRAFRLKLGKYVLSYFAILRHLLRRRNSYKFISAAKQPSNSRMKRGYFDLRLRKYLRNLRLASMYPFKDVIVVDKIF